MRPGSLNSAAALPAVTQLRGESSSGSATIPVCRHHRCPPCRATAGRARERRRGDAVSGAPDGANPELTSPPSQASSCHDQRQKLLLLARRSVWETGRRFYAAVWHSRHDYWAHNSQATHMPHWLIKSVMQRALSWLPASHYWNTLCKQYVTRSLELAPPRFD